MPLRPRAVALAEERSVPAPLGAVGLVRAVGIRKRWGRGTRPVLDGVDFSMSSGELVGIVGRNGVGKTTFLRVLGGLIDPDEGSVTIAGLEPHRDRRAFLKVVSFLPAGNSGLYARLTVQHNLELWSDLALIPRARRRDAVSAAIERFDLGELARRRADRLSMGQRQRVRLAVVTLHEPRVLLLDEPANSLDAEGIALLSATIETTRRAGGCVVWCAPQIDPEALGLDRQLTLSDGLLA